MGRLVSHIGALAVLTLALCSGCTDPELGGRYWLCDDAAACASGFVCLDGVCRPPGWSPENVDGGDIGGGDIGGSPDTAAGPACSAEACADDGDPCTGPGFRDSDCHCVYPAANDGTSCDDGSACTEESACDGGLCVGAPSVSCEADGICNPASGACVPTGMEEVAGATLQMGSGDDVPDRGSDEAAHAVSVTASFLIDLREVTNAEYLRCVSDEQEGCPAPAACDSGVGDWLPSGQGVRAGRDAFPVRCVTWAMAASYCEWAGKRLCSEAEWELACVSGTHHRTFPWGDAWPETPETHVNCAGGYCFDPFDGASPVGSFPAGAGATLGLLDLSGNVAEWVFDAYEERYQDDVPVDPHGPCGRDADSCSVPLRVVRGGSYASDRAGLRCAARRAELAEPLEGAAPADVGIRCCAEL